MDYRKNIIITLINNLLTSVLLLFLIICVVSCSGKNVDREYKPKLHVNFLQPTVDADLMLKRPIIAVQFSNPVKNINTTTFKLYELSTNNAKEIPTESITLKQIYNLKNSENNQNLYQFVPDQDLKSNHKYQIKLSDQIVDEYGNKISNKLSFNFITNDLSVATLEIHNNASDNNQTNLSPIITLRFSKSVSNIDTNNITMIQESNNTSIPIKITALNEYTYELSLLDTSKILSQNSKYILKFTHNIIDESGNLLQLDDYSFTTGSVTPIILTSNVDTFKDGRATNEPNVTLHFNQLMKGVDKNSVYLYDDLSFTNPISLSLKEYNVELNTYKFHVNTQLASNKDYYLVLAPNTITANSGIAFVPNSQGYELKFTTADFQMPEVLISPINNSKDVVLGAPIQLRFNKIMKDVNNHIKLYANNDANHTSLLSSVECNTDADNKFICTLIPQQDAIKSNSAYTIDINNLSDIYDMKLENVSSQFNTADYSDLYCTLDFIKDKNSKIVLNDQNLTLSFNKTISGFDINSPNSVALYPADDAGNPSGDMVKILYYEHDSDLLKYRLFLDGSLLNNTKYVLLLGNQIQDVVHKNLISTSNKFVFTTGNFLPTKITNITPVNNSTANINNYVTLEFSRAVKNKSLASSVKITNTNNNQIVTQDTICEQGGVFCKIYFTYDFSSNYQLDIANSIVDIEDNLVVYDNNKINFSTAKSTWVNLGNEINYNIMTGYTTYANNLQIMSNNNTLYFLTPDHISTLDAGIWKSTNFDCQKICESMVFDSNNQNFIKKVNFLSPNMPEFSIINLTNSINPYVPKEEQYTILDGGKYLKKLIISNNQLYFTLNNKILQNIYQYDIQAKSWQLITLDNINNNLKINSPIVVTGNNDIYAIGRTQDSMLVKLDRDTGKFLAVIKNGTDNNDANTNFSSTILMELDQIHNIIYVYYLSNNNSYIIKSYNLNSKTVNILNPNFTSQISDIKVRQNGDLYLLSIDNNNSLARIMINKYDNIKKEFSNTDIVELVPIAKDHYSDGIWYNNILPQLFIDKDSLYVAYNKSFIYNKVNDSYAITTQVKKMINNN